METVYQIECHCNNDELGNDIQSGHNLPSEQLYRWSAYEQVKSIGSRSTSAVHFSWNKIQGWDRSQRRATMNIDAISQTVKTARVALKASRCCRLGVKRSSKNMTEHFER